MNKRQFKKTHCLVEYKGCRAYSRHPVPVRERARLKSLFHAYLVMKFEQEVQAYMCDTQNQWQVIKAVAESGTLPGWRAA